MTSNDHDDLTDRLTALADGPAPPPGFDAARSITEGTTRLRRRKRATVGAVAAVTVAVVATTALLAPGGTTATPAPPAALTPTISPSPSATPTPTPVGFDPLTTEVHFGWLPDWAHGEQSVGYIKSYHGYEAEAKNIVDRDSAARIIVQLYQAGVEPPMTTSGGHVALGKVDADPIDGRTAYWAVADHHQPTLRWQTASGRWAEITGYGDKPSDVTQEILHKAAADVRFGQWNVPLPVQFTGLPETFKVTDVELTRPADELGNWSLWLGFRIDDKTVSVGVDPVGPRPTYTDTAGSPYIDPHPPLTAVQNGLNLTVGAGSGVPAALEQLGGLPWLLSHIKSLGPDDTKWTTNVVVP
ncbi:hypothetical protein [Kitasatospora sp. NPDC093558]|uniref:hypothetical protein n=1 Tax=Kitasatospora sp. NPDC093558 TaxID=3155201 RepID=UPI0034136806